MFAVVLRLALFGYLFFYPQKAGEEARDVAVERFGRNKRAGNATKKKREPEIGRRVFLTKIPITEYNKICCKRRTDCRMRPRADH